MRRTIIFFFASALLACFASNEYIIASQNVRKISDVVIYEDSLYYVAFPSVVKADGKYIVAFRRAPNRVVIGEQYPQHVDMNSYLVSVSSSDGYHWTKNPELIYAHSFGGSQDPCLLKLRDGTLLCSSYGWIRTTEDAISKMKHPVESFDGWVSLGGYIMRSFDHGKTWDGPIYPPAVKSATFHTPWGNMMPAYNRGQMCETESGRILWAVASLEDENAPRTSVHLLYSDDKGETWKYSGVVASDKNVIFNEASVYETPKGDIIVFLRTENPEIGACIARSSDGGRTFKWQPMGFYGHPLAAVRLPDNRVFLTYGYRKEPCGIRARILNPECTDFATSEEIVLRDDNGPGTDVGYSWPVMMDEKHVLVVYYITRPDGLRQIAGTIVEVSCPKASSDPIAERSTDSLFLNSAPRKNMILDVDMCTDVDDVCAVRIATALDDKGVIDLKGVAFSVTGSNNLDALRGFLLYENKPDVLIGRSSVPNIPDHSPYWNLMAQYSDGKVNSMDAVKMYRKILSESDTPVDIVTTGYVTNLELLLKSGPDEYSDLSGADLVRKKCGQLYLVGTTYPEGRCNNIFYVPEARTAADYVSRNWPYPILFMVNNVGGALTCGGLLQVVDKESHDIVTRSLDAFGTKNGRNAWDPFGVWCGAYACGKICRVGFKRANLSIDVKTGYNRYSDAADGRHFVIYRLCDDDDYYNTLMDCLLIEKAKLN